MDCLSHIIGFLCNGFLSAIDYFLFEIQNFKPTKLVLMTFNAHLS